MNLIPLYGRCTGLPSLRTVDIHWNVSDACGLPDHVIKNQKSIEVAAQQKTPGKDQMFKKANVREIHERSRLRWSQPRDRDGYLANGSAIREETGLTNNPNHRASRGGG